ncbi:hypothetical protein TruAng_004264 [Truncatella angustata]|nr:hypothetical protein TruAng_004264 [Truncatella angustata]
MESSNAITSARGDTSPKEETAADDDNDNDDDYVFPFLKLPLELRLAVYRLLLRHRAPIYHLQDFRFHPAILRACRSVGAEACAVLYQENTFGVCCWVKWGTTPLAHMLGIYLTRDDDDADADGGSGSSSSSNNNDGVRLAHQRLTTTLPWKGFRRFEVEIHPGRAIRHAIAPVCAYLDALPEVHHLGIKIMPSVRSSRPGAEPAYRDLAGLGELRQIRHVVVQGAPDDVREALCAKMTTDRIPRDN